jgi:hypothetical protein
VTAAVCVPGSPGWVGSSCLAAGDCKNGTSCVAGLCTESCTRACPDLPGFDDTMCVDEPALGGTSCVRQCAPEQNDAECSVGTHCVVRTRAAGGSSHGVCEPS